MTWVITREDDYGFDLYWTGQTSDYGFPIKTKDREFAAEFTNARAAYEAAKDHRKLEWWRVRAT